MRIPKYAPIPIVYNQDQLKNEIIESGILNDGKIATSHIHDGKNYWDNNINFKAPIFEKLNQVPLWDSKEHNFVVQRGIDTFKQVNVTTHSDNNQIDEVWIHNNKVNYKVSKWVQYHRPWAYRTDYNLPYLQSVVEQFNLEFVSMIRIVYQTPPSIGLIHADNLPQVNDWFFKNEGVSITLNVSTGGARLYFLNNEEEITIDEVNTPCWHFDDSVIHCTNEVKDERIQIRIYGKHKNYLNLMDLSHAIY
jgi:hypothetical protein